MANEIKVTKSVVYENGTLKWQYSPGTINLPQATKGFHVQTITATTAEADVAFSGLGTPGLCLLRNLESTTTGKTLNYGWKSSTGGLVKYGKLTPKDLGQVRYGTSDMVIRYKAASGTLQVEIIHFEA